MSASYTPRTWRERLGTNLNKFLKTSETTGSVILENSPDAITQAGTPFTAAAMNNLENGITNNYWFEERALGQTLRLWYGMAAAPNGDVYACIPNGGIYKQSGGTGNFIALGQNEQLWQSMTAAPNGDVYAADNGGDIYKQSGGTGDFVALSQTSRPWSGMAAAPNGDIYAASFGGDIYKQSGGTGDFVALGQTGRGWRGMAAAPNGDIYAASFGGDIYKQSGGTGDFVALGQTERNWNGLAAAPNGDIYACVGGDGYLYKQSGGSGDFVVLGQNPRDWYSITAASNGYIYAGVGGGDIYKTSYSPITPASIFPVTVTTADVTVTENRFQTIRFSGALTGNRVVTMPADVRQYKLICDCTGSYYIHVKTASGTGVYLAPGDAADVYCDGTNIVKLPGGGKLHTISAARSSVKALAAGVPTPITDWTITNNYLGQQGAQYFTALQACTVTVYVSSATASGTAGTGEFMASTYVNDIAVFVMRTIDGSYGASLSGSYRVALAAGDKLDVRFLSTSATNLTASCYLRLVVE